jgi:hypothetical protein
MKTLILLLLLILLGGCASPYYPVYVTSEGDYYIAERNTNGPYYGTGSMMYSDVGVYPWWTGAYTAQTFEYFSPNFYPHYFSIWYPPGYSQFYGFYGGYHAYWCPPYRIRRHDGRRSATGRMGSPVMPPVAAMGPAVTNPDLWRAIDRSAVSREIVIRQSTGWNSATPSASFPVQSSAGNYFGRSQRSSPGSSHRANGSFPRTRSSVSTREAALTNHQ